MGLAQVDGHTAQCMTLGTLQTVAIANVSNIGTAFGSNTKLIRVWASTKCHVRTGFGSLTALVTDTPLSAEVAEYFAVLPSSNIAVIRDVADGTLYVTEDA